MPGDSEFAEKEASWFAGWLQEKYDNASAESRLLLSSIQDQWYSMYRTAGHIRLGQALLAVDMNKERP